MRLLLIITLFLVLISLSEAAGKKKRKQVEKAKKSKKTIQNTSRFGGDMLGVVPNQKGVMRKGSTFSSRLWPNGVVYYQIKDNVFSIFEKEGIKMGMEEISSVTCIQFKERTNEEDYINLIKGSGCYSYVGRIGGCQDLSLGIGCLYTGTVIHELMHALGFFHEHMRSDRDSYLKIHYNNVIPDAKSNFEKVPTYMNHLYTKFDYNSIMIYGSKSFSKNGRNTMDSKDSNYKLSDPYDKDKMTELDIISVKKMYNCT